MTDLVKYEARDGQEITLGLESIRKYLVRGHPEKITEQECMYFLGVCKSRGLNPFKNDCYLIKYSSDPAQIITSIDYFRSRARAQPDCKGWRNGIIVQNKDGQIKDSFGLILPEEKLLGGFFEATPEGWDYPFRLEVNLGGYIKKTNAGQITKFWQPDNQPTMIAKVAESQGLRTLWPDEFQGLYLEDDRAVKSTPIDITNTAFEKKLDRINPPEPPPPTPETPKSKPQEKREAAPKKKSPLTIYLERCAEYKSVLGEDIYYGTIADVGFAKSNEAKKKEDWEKVLSALEEAKLKTIICVNNNEPIELAYCNNECAMRDGCPAFDDRETL